MRDHCQVHRIVVKVGTNLLSSSDGIDEACVDAISAQIAALKERGYQVLLVSSGAIGLGAKELRLKGKVKLVKLRQACASIGQPLLMSSWRRSFKQHGLLCSQLLLTRRELNNRLTYVNLRNSVSTLLELGVVPIFNENDTVSTAEIGTAFGDNDRMSALVASKIDADLLVILTDTQGFFTGDPKKDTSARLIEDIEALDENMLSLAGSSGSTFSTGGMKTKLLAAKIARQGGCASIIASGYEPNVLQRLLSGEPLGTYIHADKRLSQRSRWILNSTPLGTIRIDEGAVQALRAHKSLLPSGIIAVEGVFRAGDVVMINDIAKAVPYYNSTEIVELEGCQSRDIPARLKRGKADVVFRPEDIVFLDHAE